MNKLLAACVLAASSAALAQEIGAKEISTEGPGGAWTLKSSDRVFLITSPADTMEPMSFRAGTVDQLQTVQAGTAKGFGSNSGYSGYVADVFADFAPTRWLQVGLTMNYGTVGDPATLNLPAPTGYVKAQVLRQDTAGVDAAFAISAKKIGFSRPTDLNPNAGELEGQLLLSKRMGKVLLSANGVFGKSFTAPDSDAELKLAAGYYLAPNLVVGLDSITRYDTSFDGGPLDGTRYWELTGGAMATWKLGNLGLSALAGMAAPMHTPLGVSGLGVTGMLQAVYTL